MEPADVAIAVIVRGRKVLICRRKDDVPLPGYWEFPGGKRQAGETIEQCLRREVKEETALLVHPLHAFPPIVHDYPHGQVRLHPFLCHDDGRRPRPLGCAQLCWVAPHELRHYRFPPANATLIEQVIARLKRIFER